MYHALKLKSYKHYFINAALFFDTIFAPENVVERLSFHLILTVAE